MNTFLVLVTSLVAFLLLLGGSSVTAQEKMENNSSLTGDAYLDDAYANCQTKDVLGCAKYRALNYIHKIAQGHVSSARSWGILPGMEGNVRLIRLQGEPLTGEESFELFDAAVPRSGDNEIFKLFRFGLRETERFARTHAVVLNVPESTQGVVPRIVSEDDIESGRALEDQEGRGKKKKLALLLPLLVLFKFFKLKVLLIPILLGVLAIKKILILGAIFLPSVLGVLKFCKQQPLYHEYSASGPYDYGVSAYGASGASGGSYGKDYSRRNWDAQNLAYRQQQQQQV